MRYCTLWLAAAMLPKGVSFGQAGVEWQHYHVGSGQVNLDSTTKRGMPCSAPASGLTLQMNQPLKKYGACASVILSVQVDQDFFNKFKDDFDEDDMKMPIKQQH